MLSVAWWSTVNGPAGGGALSVLARVGESFFAAMAGIQLAMVLLAGPGGDGRGDLRRPGARACWRRWPRPTSPTPRSSWGSSARGWPRSWRCWPPRCRSRRWPPCWAASISGRSWACSWSRRRWRCSVAACAAGLATGRLDPGRDPGRAGDVDVLAAGRSGLVDALADLPAGPAARLVLEDQSDHPGLRPVHAARLCGAGGLRGVRGRDAGDLGRAGGLDDRRAPPRHPARGGGPPLATAGRGPGDGPTGCRARRSTAIPCSGATGAGAGRRGWPASSGGPTGRARSPCSGWRRSSRYSPARPTPPAVR